MRRLVLIAAVAIVAVAAFSFLREEDAGVSGERAVPAAGRTAVQTVGGPTLGAALFAENCARCHGAQAQGTDAGPPLVHPVYEPSHHGDVAFLLAVRNGVRAHHWPYGNMPPLPGVSDQAVAEIVAHVRALQRAAGIN
ncbi:MAG: cytochrome c [Hyphomicrobiaceae bacterium]|nr:cytochrome c [Hyphomicrobiaceae bacterium]